MSYLNETEIALLEDAAKRNGLTFDELVAKAHHDTLMQIASEEYAKQAIADAKTGGDV